MNLSGLWPYDHLGHCQFGAMARLFGLLLPARAASGWPPHQATNLASELGIVCVSNRFVPPAKGKVVVHRTTARRFVPAGPIGHSKFAPSAFRFAPLPVPLPPLRQAAPATGPHG